MIAVDAKKNARVGDFKTAGPRDDVPCHDFATLGIGKACPSRVYDVARHAAWVSMGQDHDTGPCAVYTIERWRSEPGQTRYPAAHDLYLVADGGGSNAARARLWKVELQRCATARGLTIHVSRGPPGTSKWHYVEHRLFSFISRNWRGRPLTTFKTLVEWIGHTKTQTGLTVWAEWGQGTYPTASPSPRQRWAPWPLNTMPSGTEHLMVGGVGLGRQFLGEIEKPRPFKGHRSAHLGSVPDDQRKADPAGPWPEPIILSPEKR